MGRLPYVGRRKGWIENKGDVPYVKETSSWGIELGGIDSEFEYCETSLIVS